MHTRTYTRTHTHSPSITVPWIFPSPSRFNNLCLRFWNSIPNFDSKYTTKSQLHDLKQAQNSENSQLHQTLIDPAVNLVFERMKSQLTDYKDKLDHAQSDLSAWKFTPDRLAAQRDHVLPHTRIRKLTLLLLNIDPQKTVLCVLEFGRCLFVWVYMYFMCKFSHWVFRLPTTLRDWTSTAFICGCIVLCFYLCTFMCFESLVNCIRLNALVSLSRSGQW